MKQPMILVFSDYLHLYHGLIIYVLCFIICKQTCLSTNLTVQFNTCKQLKIGNNFNKKKFAEKEFLNVPHFQILDHFHSFML